MSAIEMMVLMKLKKLFPFLLLFFKDPKMDAGMTQNQTQSKIKSIEAGIEVGSKFSKISKNILKLKKKNKLLKTDDFTIEEKLAIVDITLRDLVTWLDGSSLAQTLFTNLYLHEPNILQDLYMKNFTIAILKIVDRMRNKISTSGTFEEVFIFGVFFFFNLKKGRFSTIEL